MPDAPLSRRAFLRFALWPLTVPLLEACRLADADDREPSPPPVAGDSIGFVYDNHLHDAVLAKADIEAGEPLSIHIQGHSTHDHVVELTAGQLADVRAGREVSLRSSNEWGHAHDVVFNRKRPG
jgi:hypothetical protein